MYKQGQDFGIDFGGKNWFPHLVKISPTEIDPHWRTEKNMGSTTCLQI